MLVCCGQSASWGRFERPKNIPEAFGGNQVVPLGGVKLEGDEAWEKKYRDLMVGQEKGGQQASGHTITGQGVKGERYDARLEGSD